MCETPIILSRGQDGGVVHAQRQQLYTSRLARVPGRVTAIPSALFVPYHNWSYTVEGDLVDHPPGK